MDITNRSFIVSLRLLEVCVAPRKVSVEFGELTLDVWTCKLDSSFGVMLCCMCSLLIQEHICILKPGCMLLLVDEEMVEGSAVSCKVSGVMGVYAFNALYLHHT